MVLSPQTQLCWTFAEGRRRDTPPLSAELTQRPAFHLKKLSFLLTDTFQDGKTGNPFAAQHPGGRHLLFSRQHCNYTKPRQETGPCSQRLNAPCAVGSQQETHPRDPPLTPWHTKGQFWATLQGNRRGMILPPQNDAGRRGTEQIVKLLAGLWASVRQARVN